MEKQYSVDFFTSFVENLQNLCQMYLSYDQFVEVSGFISVEIDNFRKERYVLSEILQTSGDVISESYCTKSCQNSPLPPRNPTITCRKALQEIQGKSPIMLKRSRQHVEDQRTRQSNFDEDEPEVVSFEAPTKVRKLKCLEGKSTRDYQDIGTVSVAPQDIPSLCQRKPAESHEMEGITSNCIQSESGSRKVFEHAPIEQTSAWADDICIDQKNSDSSFANHTKVRQRTWHVTKEEFPVPSASSSHSFDAKQTDRCSQVAVSEEAVRTLEESPMSEKTNTPLHDDSLSPQRLASSFGVSVTSKDSSSSNTLICKQELETSHDSLVYTDIDDDDGSSLQDRVGSKPVSLGFSESEKDFILIELDSDNEDLTLDDTENVSDISVSNPPRQDLSSFSKPQRFAVKRLIQFLEIKKIPGPVCSLPPEQLDPVLAEFYQCVRKCGGQEFGSRSLKTIQQYLEIYFRANNYPASITKSPEFQTSRDVMAAKVKQLKNHEESSLTLKREDVDHLYACGQLGDSTPDSIINTLWLMNTVRLNIKGCKKHLELKWGDLMLQTIPGGKEILIYGGSNLFVQRNLKQPERCFVSLYKKYWSMRPRDTLDPDSPFYLAPSEYGFKRSKYGGRIGTVFKRMLLNAGLPSDLKILNIDIL